jgi:hypothetical protein
MTLKEQIQSSRKIRDTSLNTYLTNLKKLKKKITGEPLNDDIKFLNDFKTVMDEINKNEKITMKKNLLTAVLVALGAQDKKNEKLIQLYGDELKKLNTVYIDFLKEQKKTPKQEQNWIEYEELINIKNALYEKIKKLKNENIECKEFETLQYYIILSTYLNFPLRNNFANMKILKNTEYKKIDENEKNKNNYLVIFNKNKKQFYINYHKTSTKLGAKIYDIPQDLNKDINLWLKCNKSGYYIVKKDRKTPLSANGLTKLLNKLFNKYAKGKKISSSMLRHIIISYQMRGEKTIKEKQEEAENNFLHSAEVHEQYRKI